MVKTLLPVGTSVSRKYPSWSVLVVLVEPLILISASARGVVLNGVWQCTSPSKEPVLGFKALHPFRKRVIDNKNKNKNKRDENDFDDIGVIWIGFDIDISEFILECFAC